MKCEIFSRFQDTVTRKIYSDSKSEYAYPDGTYGAGMDAPEYRIRADKPISELAQPEHQPEHVEPEKQKDTLHLVPLWNEVFHNDDKEKHKETLRQNKSLIEQCVSLEQIKNALLTLSDKDMLNQAAYMRIHAQFIGFQGRMKTSEDVAEEIAEIIIARRQRKAKAEARKSAPKPATRKPRHAKKIDDSRQILIQFEELDTQTVETPAAVQPAKPKARRVSRPRIKKDYSRQILINFGEDITNSKTNQRKAA